MRRILLPLLAACTVALSWLGMMIVHEAGHVLGAWLTGGTVVHVVLHPLAFSRTDVWPNPRPLAVAWAGPIVGSALPLLAFAVAYALNAREGYLLRFFAGFCLIANGVYIGVGSIWQIGDTYPLLLHEAHPWSLWAFGAACAGFGLYLWHGLGPRLGLRQANDRLRPGVVYTLLGLLVLTVMLEVLIGGE